jgi:hypothetical protein
MTHSAAKFARGLCRWRLQTFPGRRTRFALLATRWLYFTNHSYTGERRYWIRVGEWRKSFGKVRVSP